MITYLSANEAPVAVDAGRLAAGGTREAGDEHHRRQGGDNGGRKIPNPWNESERTDRVSWSRGCRRQ